jgi:hypothetical protein
MAAPAFRSICSICSIGPIQQGGASEQQNRGSPPLVAGKASVWHWPRELTAYYPLKRVTTQQEFIFNGKKQVQHRVAA